MAIQFGDSDSDGSALSRPFGVALLFAGCDPDHGPQLFHMDPSGTYVRYDAKAIGSGSEGESHFVQGAIHKQGLRKLPKSGGSEPKSGWGKN